MGKEIGAGSIEHAFSHNGAECLRRNARTDGFDHEDEGPTHDQIDQERKTRPTVDGRDLIDSTCHGHGPQQTEHRPTQGTADDTDTDWRVGSGNHHVDADVVEHAEAFLRPPGHPPMVECAGSIHQEHAAGEERDTEGILPIALVAESKNDPRCGEGEKHTGQMGEGVEQLLVCAFTNLHVK